MTRDARGPLLSVRELRHTFQLRGAMGEGREVQALRGIHLDIHPGECLALVGESGSGKTTLARAILRLIQPSAGAVFYRDRDVLTLSPRDLRAYRGKAQMVFQDPFGSLNPRFRAGEMLGEVLKVHGRGGNRRERGQRVRDLLKLVGLPEGAGQRFPHEFSGGQRQRLGLARALSVEPEFLILDEPVSALDLSVQAQILNLIRELQESLGLTCLLVAHDLSVVRQVAHRIAVLYLGKVVEVGPVEALLTTPLHPYTRGLLAAADPGMAKSVIGSGDVLLPGDPPGAMNPPTGCALFPRCPNTLKDEECKEENPPLEEVGKARFCACWKLRKQAARP